MHQKMYIQGELQLEHTFIFMRLDKVLEINRNEVRNERKGEQITIFHELFDCFFLLEGRGSALLVEDNECIL